MQKLLLSLLISLLFFSCKKAETTQADSITGQWQWVIQRENNPAYFSTPATTGIQETIEFNADGSYSVTQNNTVVNSGTYKTIVDKCTRDNSRVSGVLYSNSRVTDSVAYYEVRVGNDSLHLMFCHDLIGSYGASSRFYGKQK
jgi:hypothetical protein